MVDAKLAEKLQILLDKQEIYELACRYCRGLDRLDHALLRSVYHDDATDHRGFFTGGPDAFCELAISLLAEHKSNQHLLGNTLIEVEGDIAFGEIYFQAFHRIVENGLEKDLIIAGRYVDRYERRGGAWKIAHRTELNDWCQTAPATDDWIRATPEALTGARKPDDFVYDRVRLRSI